MFDFAKRKILLRCIDSSEWKSHRLQCSSIEKRVIFFLSCGCCSITVATRQSPRKKKKKQFGFGRSKLAIEKKNTEVERKKHYLVAVVASLVLQCYWQFLVCVFLSFSFIIFSVSFKYNTFMALKNQKNNNSLHWTQCTQTERHRQADRHRQKEWNIRIHRYFMHVIKYKTKWAISFFEINGIILVDNFLHLCIFSDSCMCSGGLHSFSIWLLLYHDDLHINIGTC